MIHQLKRLSLSFTLHFLAILSLPAVEELVGIVPAIVWGFALVVGLALFDGINATVDVLLGSPETNGGGSA